MTQDRVGAVIAAAGDSRRMEGGDKILAVIAGKTVLAHVLDAFQECAAVDRVVVVLNEASLERGREIMEEHGFSRVKAICRGGERRQDSVYEGLKRLEGCGWIVIHDGARPCITVDLIERGVLEAAETGSAIAAVPVKETVKRVGGDRVIEGTPPRHDLWLAQTPQVFRSDIIMEAYGRQREEVTDDAALVEALGHKVKVYMGSYDNIKITTPEDLKVAEMVLRNRKAI